MSVQTELQRIIQAKADIIDSIEAKGVTVPSGTTIDNLDDYVDQIQQGGGNEWTANECFWAENVDTISQYFSITDCNKFNIWYQIVNSGSQPSDENWAKLNNIQYWYTPGQRVYFYGNNLGGLFNTIYTTPTSKTEYYCKFQSTPKCKIGGNLISLISKNKLSYTPNNAFRQLFMNANIINIDELIFPEYASLMCYYQTFQGTQITSLNCDILPKNIDKYSYQYMFSGCKSLTTITGQLSTNTELYSYSSMFLNCTALTTVPSNLLPATTLTAQYCYHQMFYGCTSLTNVPNLPATTLSIGCYQSMFYGCTSLTTVSSNLLPVTNLQSYCYQNMFWGCTSLTTAPVLPATNLAYNCYGNMFNGCTSLNYVKAMFTTDISSSTSYTNYWLNNVAATGTFVKNANATWSRTDATGIPSGWTVETETPAAA